MEHGIFSDATITALGVQTTLSCKFGYLLRDSASFLCDNDGNWKGSASCGKLFTLRETAQVY